MQRQRGLSWKKISEKIQSEKKFLSSGKHFSTRFQARRVQKTKNNFSWKNFPFVDLDFFRKVAISALSANFRLPLCDLRGSYR
jgi:hypothetical protein